MVITVALRLEKSSSLKLLLDWHFSPFGSGNDLNFKDLKYP
jgi:hypothetical protein